MAQQEKPNSHIKILSVVWYKVLPAVYGGQKAVAYFNEHLGRLATLTCLCSYNNGVSAVSYDVKNFLPGGKTQFINPLVWRKIYVIAKKEKITHLILEFPYHGIAAIICRTLLRVKLIVNTHNIEFLRFKEQGKWWWRLLFYFERWVLKKSSAAFFKTEGDKTTAIRYFGLKEKNLAVIPYGIEQKIQPIKSEARKTIRQRHAIAEGEKILLFAGTLDYTPNADAVVAIEKFLIPALLNKSFAFKLIVCGRLQLPSFQHLRNIQHENLIFAGEVSDIETYFAVADVFTAPVLSGGGVQTKIMDALSFHVNVVCFASKCPEVPEAGRKLVAVPEGDWTAFASAVIAAAETETLTPEIFFMKYSWEAIAATAYQKIVAC